MTSRSLQIFSILPGLVVSLKTAKVADTAECIEKMHVNRPAAENSYHDFYATQFAE